MKQELPNLVDERRFRRREPEAVERDEFGRVSFMGTFELVGLTGNSANGPRKKYPLTLSQFKASIFVLRLLAMVELT